VSSTFQTKLPRPTPEHPGDRSHHVADVGKTGMKAPSASASESEKQDHADEIPRSGAKQPQSPAMPDKKSLRICPSEQSALMKHSQKLMVVVRSLFVLNGRLGCVATMESTAYSSKLEFLLLAISDDELRTAAQASEGVSLGPGMPEVGMHAAFDHPDSHSFVLVPAHSVAPVSNAKSRSAGSSKGSSKSSGAQSSARMQMHRSSSHSSIASLDGQGRSVVPGPAPTENNAAARVQPRTAVTSSTHRQKTRVLVPPISMASGDPAMPSNTRPISFGGIQSSTDRDFPLLACAKGSEVLVGSSNSCRLYWNSDAYVNVRKARPAVASVTLPTDSAETSNRPGKDIGKDATKTAQSSEPSMDQTHATDGEPETPSTPQRFLDSPVRAWVSGNEQSSHELRAKGDAEASAANLDLGADEVPVIPRVFISLRKLPRPPAGSDTVLSIQVMDGHVAVSTLRGEVQLWNVPASWAEGTK